MVLVPDKIEQLELAALLRIQATEADQVIQALIIQDQLALEEIEVDPVHLELAPLVAAQAAMALEQVAVALVQVVQVQADMEQAVVVVLVAMEQVADLVHPAQLEHMVAVLAQQDHRAAEQALPQVELIWVKAKEIIPVQ